MAKPMPKTEVNNAPSFLHFIKMPLPNIPNVPSHKKKKNQPHLVSLMALELVAIFETTGNLMWQCSS